MEPAVTVLTAALLILILVLFTPSASSASAFNGVIYKLKVFERVSTAAEIIAETGTSDLFISISGTSVSAQYSAPPPTLKLNVLIV